MIDVEPLVKTALAEADAWDEHGLPPEAIRLAAHHGLLGLDRPVDLGGGGTSARELGDVTAELGAVCSSLRALTTVQGMVNAALDRWGTAEQRAEWLPQLVGGDRLAAVACTEPGAGTDLSAVACEFRPGGGGDHRVYGRKLWVTFGEVADVLLVLGRAPGGLVAGLVETDRAGVEIEPVTGQLGLRGARLAHVTLDGAALPERQLIAPPGFGLSHVLGTALDHGRYTVAWGCVGMARACLDEAVAHVRSRTQGGAPLGDHQTVRAALGRCAVTVRAAEELCVRAAALREDGDPGSIVATVTAKYAAARAAASVSAKAVQLLGAAGCAPGSAVARFFRDAKVMQIIEGADEVAEVMIGSHLLGLPHAGGAR
ncbi:acyl-CoA dehydrogenase family protein [Streptomyces sp. NPDC047315]|uniref:acyl-CoA dehydrogenase family protein n=1 Tax=Streptomyces sp. NPDC047315 TaxID=3155142 RepID=UPI0033E58AC8